MAETKLLELELGESIKSIARLRAELKEAKKDFELASVGSEQFAKSQQAVKGLEAEIKKLTNTTKAESNALGGINTSAKFVNGSLGSLKQQIKENNDVLLKINSSGKLFKALQQEQAAVVQKRIDIEKKLPSLFQERIKMAVNEVETLKDLKQAIKEYTDKVIQGVPGAAEKLAELKDKLDDVKDATNSLKGSGVESLNNSVNLLKEGFANFDADKINLAFESIGTAMKAIPIFLIIEGVKLLIDNFDNVVKFFKSFTEGAIGVRQAERALEKLTIETAKNKAVLEARATVLDSEINLMKAQKASYSDIALKEQEAYQNKINLIRADLGLQKQTALTAKAKLREISLNDSITESVDRLYASTLRKLGKDKEAAAFDIILAAEKKDRAKEAQKEYDDSINAIKQGVAELEALGNNYKAQTIENTREQAELAKENRRFLKQLGIDAQKEDYDRAKAQLEFDKQIEIEDLKLKRLSATQKAEAIKDINLKYARELQKISIEELKRNQEEEISVIQSGIDAKKSLGLKSFDEERALAKAQQDLVLNDINSTYEQRLKAETDYNNTLHQIDKAENERRLEDSISNNEVIISQNKFNLEAQFQARKEVLDAQRELELQSAEGNEAKQLEIKQKYVDLEMQLQRDKIAKKQELNNQEIAFATGLAETLIGVGQLISKDQEEQAAFAKSFALINILANEAKAISDLTATVFSPLSPDNLLTGGIAAYAKLATGTAVIVSNALQAKNIINSFEQGGYTGDGNPKDVSTNLGSKPYTYHKGEYVTPNRVLNTPRGKQLVGELESLRKGISNPAPWIGGKFDGGFTARSISSNADSGASTRNMLKDFISSLPTPVLPITELKKVQDSNRKAVSVSSL